MGAQAPASYSLGRPRGAAPFPRAYRKSSANRRPGSSSNSASSHAIFSPVAFFDIDRHVVAVRVAGWVDHRIDEMVGSRPLPRARSNTTWTGVFSLETAGGARHK